MGHEKSRNQTVRLRPHDEDALDALAAALRTDRSEAIRFCVHEKVRALGLTVPARAATPAPPSVAEPPVASAAGAAPSRVFEGSTVAKLPARRRRRGAR